MKIIRADMATGTITTEDIEPAFTGMGGRGLTSFFINSEVPPMCDPLGPENKLIFAPGYLSGSALVNTSRLSVGAKSPLTGGIKESNVGGTVAADLAHIGISAIIVEGKPEKNKFFILKIDEDGNAALEDADKISGETMAQIIKRRGGKPNHKGCAQCIINCSNVYVDEQGKYVTSSLEYETIWAMGGMLGNNDLDAIAKLDFLCDDIGLDTISTGVAIAVAMYAEW